MCPAFVPFHADSSCLFLIFRKCLLLLFFLFSSTMLFFFGLLALLYPLLAFGQPFCISLFICICLHPNALSLIILISNLLYQVGYQVSYKKIRGERERASQCLRHDQLCQDWMGNAAKSVTLWASRQNRPLMPGEIKRSRDLRGGSWSWTLKFAQKRSWVGRWSWAEQVGSLLLRVVQVVHQQQCNGHCLCDSVQAQQLKQQLCSAQVAGQWRGETLPLFWRQSTVSPVFFGWFPWLSLHSVVPFPLCPHP